MKQITRISPAVLSSINNNIPEYKYAEEIIVGADATRYRNGEVESSCLMGEGTSMSGSAIRGQVVVGRYNTPVIDSLFIIGNGSSGTQRSNIVEVYTDTFLIKKDLEVEGGAFVNKLTVNGKLTVNETVNITGETVMSSLKTDDFRATGSSLEIDSQSNFNAPARFHLSVAIDPDEYLEVDDIRTSSGYYYLTNENAYSKEKVDNLIQSINELQTEIENVKTDLTRTQALADTIKSNSLSRDNRLKAYLQTVIERVQLLGKNPSTEYTNFSIEMRDW